MVRLSLFFGARAQGFLEVALTYLVHSLAWTLGAWLAVRVLRPAPVRENSIWRLALFGPMLSALLHHALPWGFEMFDISAGSPVTEAAGALDSGVTSLAVEPVDYAWAGVSWGAILLGAALAAGALRFAMSVFRLRRELAARTWLSSGALWNRFRGLAARCGCDGARLTRADIAVPVVLGGAEVCVPKSLEGFTDAELDAVFAHELAHLRRLDGYWFPLIGAFSALLWFLPHHAWVARRYRHSAELACDQECVALTSDPKALASALTRMASLVVAVRNQQLAPRAATHSGILLQRVRVLTLGPNAVGGRSALALPLLALSGFALPHLGIANIPRSARGLGAGESLVEQRSALDAEELELSQNLRAYEKAHSAESIDLDIVPEVLELRRSLRHVRERRATLEDADRYHHR